MPHDATKRLPATSSAVVFGWGGGLVNLPITDPAGDGSEFSSVNCIPFSPPNCRPPPMAGGAAPVLLDSPKPRAAPAEAVHFSGRRGGVSGEDLFQLLVQMRFF